MTILHHNKDTWGPDAREFNPDRWDAASLPKESIQGSVYGQLLTFLAGPRNCM
jgi:cytochrome P450